MESVVLDALAVPEDGPVNRPTHTEGTVCSHMVTTAKSEPRLGVLGPALYSIAQHPFHVLPSFVSPTHSFNIATHDELADMLAEALDDFDDAPVSDAHVRDACVEEAHVSSFYPSPSSSSSLSPRRRGSRSQQRSSDALSDACTADDTRDARQYSGSHHEQLGSPPVTHNTTSSYNRIITRSSAADDRAHPSGDLVKGAAARLTWKTGLCVPEQDAVGMAAAWLLLHLVQTIS
jgi:hypothetical protein